MELKAYLHLLMRKWWIVLPTFLITFIATLLFTLSQPAVYRSTATFIVRVGITFKDDRSFVSALDTLSRRVEIASTYAEVASSRLIKRQATEDLGLSSEQRRALSVASQLIAGTNILEIAVQGPDPTLARDFTNAIGVRTIAYVQNLYEAYELEPLDEASMSRTPVSPNRALNLALGGAFGLALGIGLAFLVAYLQTPLESMLHLGPLEAEAETRQNGYFQELTALQERFDAAQHHLEQVQATWVSTEQRADEASAAVRVLDAQRAAAEQMGAERQAASRS